MKTATKKKIKFFFKLRKKETQKFFLNIQKIERKKRKNFPMKFHQHVAHIRHQALNKSIDCIENEAVSRVEMVN